MACETRKLSSKKQWSRTWASSPTRGLTFNPKKLPFQDLHNLFLRHLPKSGDMTFLEIGCYPGRFMWYFNHFFGYKVSGMEYVQHLCEPVREELHDCGVEAEVIYGDILSYVSQGRQWDVVASLGLIEHFSNPEQVIRRHLELVKQGGYLVLTIPNHSGIYGRILKWADPKRYAIHNHMAYKEMQEAVASVGTVEILEGGYYCHLGFWSSGLYTKFTSVNRLLGKMLFAPLMGIVHVGKWLPNSKGLSPSIGLVARKTNRD